MSLWVRWPASRTLSPAGTGETSPRPTMLYGAAVPLATAGDGLNWLPPDVRGGFTLTAWLALFLLTLLVGLAVVALQRRRPDGAKAAAPAAPWLPRVGTLLALATVAGVFWVGLLVDMDRRVAPLDAVEVRVTARQWDWTFAYPDSFTSDELHLPAGRPVALVVTAKDVVHSLELPAFYLRRDAVPGRESRLWLEPSEPGESILRCAEYCGAGFDTMTARVVVQTEADYQTWVDEHANFLDRMTPEEGGQRLYATLGCKECHTLDGSPRVGPSWRGLFGATRYFVDGTTAVADSAYIHQSILEPQARIVAGFQPVMPSFQGRVTDQGVAALIAYIKTLGEETP